LQKVAVSHVTPVSYTKPLATLKALNAQNSTQRKGVNTHALLDKPKGRGKLVSLPEWLPEDVFDNLLLPYVMDLVSIDLHMWDLKSDSKLLIIAQAGLDLVIKKEDLGIDEFEVDPTGSLYGLVSIAYALFS
jgi:hypothetical protein